MANKAVFLDRDGTVMDDLGYLADPAGVKLLPGVDLAIKSLRQAGYKIVVVTNQSGVARGILTEETLEKIHSELRRKLAEKGAMLDAIYYCPFHPEGTVPPYIKESDLRKPAPGMLYQAAEELGLELPASWMVGDAERDVAAGQAAGCRSILLKTNKQENTDDEATEEDVQPDMTVRNLVDAARVILRANSQKGAQDAPAGPPPKNPYELEADMQNQEPEPAESTPDPSADPFADPFAEDAPETPREPERPSADEPPTEEDSIVRKEILRHVRQMTKQGETEEFSVINLLGGVVQILVFLMLLVVFWKALGKQEYDQALLWAVVAGVLQTMSLTFFIMVRAKK